MQTGGRGVNRGSYEDEGDVDDGNEGKLIGVVMQTGVVNRVIRVIKGG